MPLYEYRKGGQVVERVRPKPRGFEETRLAVMAADRKRDADGWHEVDETAAAGAEQQDQAAADDADGG